MNEIKFAPEGIYGAMITPFNKKGEVDFEEVKNIVAFMIDKGIDGIFPVGNIGEFLCLSEDEKRSIIKVVLEENDGKIKVIPGVSDLSVERAVEMARFCNSLGADGVVVSAPYYYPYSQEYIVRYIEGIADQSPLPVILYNSPFFAKGIDFENIINLCRHKNITAIKESSGDIKLLLKLLTLIRKENINVKVMLGWEELVYSGLTMGADGCIVCSGGIAPEILVKMRNALMEGDLRTALDCQSAIGEITAFIQRWGFPYGYKLAVLARGFNFQVYRDKEFKSQENRIRQELERVRALIDSKLEQLNCI